MFSEKQLLKLLEDNVVKSLEGKNVSVKSLLQEARYSYDIDLPTYSGFTKHQWFSKVIIIGNECHIIGNVYYQNDGESAAQQRFTSFTINIPEEIRNHPKFKVLPTAKTIARAISAIFSDTSLSAIYED